ncbi:hypothetical protein ACFFMR_04855 [Micromonospora andamanensis]|uniref:Capsule synthesis protein CapA domain-containing protein n=1 Tax=Micromonospora andamanensis TaxID=1287068 RepID=A0ABQ4I330_9ACTN|nr:hypothetical protein [Micromonospora andamanensis]GIJ12284.1 hypothetical protein Van01_54980 [Micromonospora andamanensis]
MGAHAHVLRGARRAGNAYAAYGMGNVLWQSAGLYPPYTAGRHPPPEPAGPDVLISEQFSRPSSRTAAGPRWSPGWRSAIAQHTFGRLRSYAGVEPARD